MAFKGAWAHSMEWLSVRRLARACGFMESSEALRHGPWPAQQAALNDALKEKADEKSRQACSRRSSQIREDRRALQREQARSCKRCCVEQKPESSSAALSLAASSSSDFAESLEGKKSLTRQGCHCSSAR